MHGQYLVRSLIVSHHPPSLRVQTELAVDMAITRGQLDASCFKRLLKADPRKSEQVDKVLSAKREIQTALKVDLGEAILTGPPPEKKKVPKARGGGGGNGGGGGGGGGPSAPKKTKKSGGYGD